MKEVKKGTNRSKIKKGDTVVFIAGKEYNRYDSNGKRKPFSGQVIAVDPREGKVKVEGAAIVKRHRKPVPQLNREGGIIESEGWVNISNVALLDPETGKPTRVKYEVRDGVKVRVAKSGKVIGENVRGTKAAKAEKSETTEKAEKKPAKKAAKKKDEE
jgi:large subunit ribosomal protein L24